MKGFTKQTAAIFMLVSFIFAGAYPAMAENIVVNPGETATYTDINIAGQILNQGTMTLTNVNAVNNTADSTKYQSLATVGGNTKINGTASNFSNTTVHPEGSIGYAKTAGRAMVVDNSGNITINSTTTNILNEQTNAYGGSSTWSAWGQAVLVKSGELNVTNQAKDINISSLNKGYTAEAIRIVGGQTAKFNNTGITKLTSMSDYGNNVVYLGGGTNLEFNDGDVYIKGDILDENGNAGGLAQSNNNGFSAVGETVKVGENVGTFSIELNGVGRNESVGGDGTGAIKDWGGSTYDIKAQNFTVNVNTGEHALSADKVGEYDETFGLWIAVSELTASNNTTTNIAVTNNVSFTDTENALGSDAVAVAALGSDGKINLLGNTTINAVSAAGQAVALEAVDNGVIDVGSAGKTVSLTGDVVAQSNGQITVTGAATREDGTKGVQIAGNVSVGSSSSTDASSVSLTNATVDGRILVEDNAATLTLNNVDIADQTAPSDQSGGAIGGLDAAGAKGHITISDGTFTNNSTTNAAGGAIAATGAELNVTNTTFTNNKALQNSNGGAIYAWTDTPAVIKADASSDKSTAFIGNSANSQGGAIYARGASITGTAEKKITFTGNTASSGGAVALAENANTIDNAVFNNNTATSNGGAVLETTAYGGVSPTTATISNSTFTDNAANKGGAVYVEKTGNKLTLTNDTLSGNTASTSGGAVYVETGNKLTLTNDMLSGNTASASGGALFADKDTETYINANAETEAAIEGKTTFSGNTAQKGGAIYAESEYTGWGFVGYNYQEITIPGAKVVVKNAEFTDNEATDENGGGALYVGAGATATLEGDTFAENKTKDAEGNEVANDIYNAGTITAISDNTFASGINNIGTFNFTGAGNVSTNYTGTGTTNIANSGELTNIGEMTQTQVNVAAGGELSTGIINGNLANSGTVNLMSGTVTDGLLANYTNNGEGKLNLTDKAVYNTTSNKVFTNALTGFTGDITSAEDRNAYAAENNYGTNSLAANKLTYISGRIELGDAHYTLDYAKLAKKTLEEAGSATNLVMNGNLVTEVKEDGSRKVLVDALDNNTGDAKIIQDKSMTILTLNGDLLVGSKDVTKKEDTVDALRTGTDLTIRDATSKSIDADKIELANIAGGILVTNGKSVMLGGKSATAETAGEAVVVTDKPLPEIDVDVKVGLDQATFEAVNATLAEGEKLASKTGTFSIGSEADKKYELAGKLTVNEGSSATITGQTTIAKFADIKAGGTFEAKNGTTTVKENIISEGTIKLDNATLAADVAGNGTMEVKGTSGLKGSAAFAHAEVAEGGSVTVTGSLTSDRLIAQGTNNTLAANNTQAYGTGNTVSGEGSIAYGIGHTVVGTNSGAFGDPNLVYANSSYAYGNDNTLGVAGYETTNYNLHVVGNKNYVKGTDTFVLGSGIGTSTNPANANHSVILGYGSTVPNGASYVVSVGSETDTRRIINVAAGEKPTDAVNYGQIITSASYDGTTLSLKNYSGDTIASAIISGGSGGAWTATDGTTNLTVDGTHPLEFVGDGVEITADATGGNKITIKAAGGSANAVEYDGADKSAVTLKGAEGTTIKHVADGSDDYDAVNKKQLYEAIAGAGAWTANAGGKSISVNADKPTLTFTAGDNITLDADEMSHSIKISAAGGGEDSNAVHYNADKSEIELAGANGTTIKKVADGAVAEGSTDAINGGQLYATEQRLGQAENAIGAVNDRVSAVQNELNAVSGEVKEVGAISAALAGLRFAEPSGEEGDKFVGAVAYGNYRGESAGAIGVAYKPTPNFMLSASTSVGQNYNAYNAGASLKFGKGETAKTRAELQKQVKYLNEKNLAQDAENAALKEKIAAQDELIKQLLERMEKLEKKN